MGPKERETIMTAAEELREEGRQEGERKGRKEERRNVLLKQLRVRFGELPEAAVARVNAAHPAELDLWVERVITAPSLAEVLGSA